MCVGKSIQNTEKMTHCDFCINKHWVCNPILFWDNEVIFIHKKQQLVLLILSNHVIGHFVSRLVGNDCEIDTLLASLYAETLCA